MNGGGDKSDSESSLSDFSEDEAQDMELWPPSVWGGLKLILVLALAATKRRVNVHFGTSCSGLGALDYNLITQTRYYFSIGLIILYNDYTRSCAASLPSLMFLVVNRLVTRHDQQSFEKNHSIWLITVLFMYYKVWCGLVHYYVCYSKECEFPQTPWL